MLPPKRHKSCLLLQLKLIYVLRLLASFENLIISANRRWVCWIYILSTKLYWSQNSTETCCFIVTAVIPVSLLPHTWAQNFDKKTGDGDEIVSFQCGERLWMLSSGSIFPSATVFSPVSTLDPSQSGSLSALNFWEKLLANGGRCNKWHKDRELTSH